MRRAILSETLVAPSVVTADISGCRLRGSSFTRIALGQPVGSTSSERTGWGEAVTRAPLHRRYMVRYSSRQTGRYARRYASVTWSVTQSVIRPLLEQPLLERYARRSAGGAALRCGRQLDVSDLEQQPLGSLAEELARQMSSTSEKTNHCGRYRCEGRVKGVRSRCGVRIKDVRYVSDKDIEEGTCQDKGTMWGMCRRRRC